MAQFFTDLKRILSLTALRRVVRQLLENNGLALAGQLAYLFILFLFPFLIFLLTLVGIVVNDPETILKDLARRVESFLPQETVELIRGYLDRTAKSTSLATLSRPFFSLSVLARQRQRPSAMRLTDSTESRRRARFGRYGVSPYC